MAKEEKSAMLIYYLGILGDKDGQNKELNEENAHQSSCLKVFNEKGTVKSIFERLERLERLDRLDRLDRSERLNRLDRFENYKSMFGIREI
jgi:hypothetical protein